MSDPWEIPDSLFDDPAYWRRRAASAVREAAQTEDLQEWLILQALAQNFERAAEAAERRRRERQSKAAKL
jgi:hypothetical protein